MDEINAAGGILGGRMIELIRRDDESSPPEGRHRGPRAHLQGGGRRLLRRHRLSGVARHRAAREQVEGPVHGGMGGRDPDHPQRRRPQLRLPGIGGRRHRRHQAPPVRASDVRRDEDRPHADQQPVGRIERAGPPRRGRGQRRRRDRRGREVREQRRGHDPAAHPPQGQGSGRPRPRHQRPPRRADDEVARPHGLGRAGGLPLGDLGRPVPRARRPHRGRRALRADLQLLR